MTSKVTSKWRNILTKLSITINTIIIHHLSMIRDRIKGQTIVRLTSQILQDHFVQVVNMDPTEEIMMEKGNSTIMQECIEHENQ